jgi:hypothetical protein
MKLLDGDGEIGSALFFGQRAPQRLQLVDAILQRQGCHCCLVHKLSLDGSCVLRLQSKLADLGRTVMAVDLQQVLVRRMEEHSPESSTPSFAMHQAHAVQSRTVSDLYRRRSGHA